MKFPSIGDVIRLQRPDGHHGQEYHVIWLSDDPLSEGGIIRACPPGTRYTTDDTSAEEDFWLTRFYSDETIIGTTAPADIPHFVRVVTLNLLRGKITAERAAPFLQWANAQLSLQQG